jgi:hypothetical protein
MKTYREYLVEAADDPRIPHPEDSIFISSATAQKYVRALQDIAVNPTNVSIKWDGAIALYFGRDQSGRFFINDKYMPETFHAYSPEDWRRYDTEIKKSRTARPDLYEKIAYIWPGLEAAVGKSQDVFKGDLMFVGPLEAVNNEFVFKPVTVEYHVPVDSKLGQLIAGRRALIVVHQRNGAPWNGQGLASNNMVAIIPPTAGIEFKLRNPLTLSRAAESALAQYGSMVDGFLSAMSNVAKAALEKYLIHKKIGKTNLKLGDWLKENVSGKQYQLLVGDGTTGYLIENKTALDALFRIWNAISALKENIAQQLELQVTGFKQFVAGQPQGEGFVVPTSLGLVKLVQRGGFTAAHFSGFAAKK